MRGRYNAVSGMNSSDMYEEKDMILNEDLKYLSKNPSDSDIREKLSVNKESSIKYSFPQSDRFIPLSKLRKSDSSFSYLPNDSFEMNPYLKENLLLTINKVWERAKDFLQNQN
jgi:hypothetical protein